MYDIFLEVSLWYFPVSPPRVMKPILDLVHLLNLRPPATQQMLLSYECFFYKRT